MSYTKAPRPTIKIYRGDERSVWQWLLPLILIPALVLLVVIYFFVLPGLQTGGNNQAHMMHDLRATIEQLRDENEALQNELALAKRSQEIDDQASKELAEALAKREGELVELKEELNFYKSMLSTNGDGGVSGLSIRNFLVAPGQESGDYLFKLVLARTGGGDKAIRGTVELRIQGKIGEQSRLLSWSEIAPKGAKQPAFGFQHFQRLEGMFHLPKGFEPENVLVKIVPSKGKEDALQQSFSWNSVVKGDSL